MSKANGVSVEAVSRHVFVELPVHGELHVFRLTPSVARSLYAGLGNAVRKLKR